MQPNSEPTPQDVASVAATMGQPTQQPEAQPAPQSQPAQPISQPAPTSQPAADPFTLFATQPTEAAPVTEPSQPTEPVATATEASQPVAQPVAQTPPAPEAAPTYQTYEEYLDSITQGVPKAPDQPDPSTVDNTDPNAIKGFFDDLMNTAEKRFEANYERKQAIQTAEKKGWDEAFSKYGSLRENKGLRDMVHNIRMGNFNRGIALTPTQAANQLLESLKGQYNKGVVDNQVVTTIESVQPTGGGSTAVPTTADRDATLTSFQTGGETALADYLDGEVKAGRL